MRGAHITSVRAEPRSIASVRLVRAEPQLREQRRSIDLRSGLSQRNQRFSSCSLAGLRRARPERNPSCREKGLIVRGSVSLPLMLFHGTINSAAERARHRVIQQNLLASNPSGLYCVKKLTLDAIKYKFLGKTKIIKTRISGY